MKVPTTVSGAQPGSAAVAEVEKKTINAELWQACAGPLVNLPAAGTHVVYFPQGHSEQVAASLKKSVDGQIPNYPNLPSKLLCILHNIALHADPETDEIYAQMTLQPTPSFDKDSLLRSDLSMKINKPQTEFFCKTLTASDTSTHGGFSVPRRAAEKIFPTLDFAMVPPAQELVARDLHDNVWTFRHIFRGQPKRHLLTTGWSLFVSGKRLFAGDSVLFIRDEKQQLLLGIRRANRQPTNLSSSVLSSDSMHIGILAAAAHATANNSPFTVFYNPRASPSEFVIPLAKYYKATCSNQISLGMRFRMMFETEESGTRRYMGTITGISDLDPVGWKNSQWRNLQVGWDESTAGELRTRVSLWEIEPITAPFFLCPTPPLFSFKRSRLPGMTDDYSSDIDTLFRRTMPWFVDDSGLKDSQSQPGMNLVQWMNTQPNPPGPNSVQSSYTSSVMQSIAGSNNSHQLGLPEQLNHFSSSIPPQQQNDMQSVLADHANQPLDFPDNQLQQLQHLQQSLLTQQSAMQQQSRDNHQVIDAPQLHSVAQQMVRNDIQTNVQFERITSQPKQLAPQLPVHKGHSRNSSLLTGAAGGGQSAVTDDAPSCSASPSANNCTVGSQSLVNVRNLYTVTTGDEIVLPSAVLSNPSGSEAISSHGNLGKGFHHKADVRPSLNVSQDQTQSVFASQLLINPSGTQIDYLDSSSSATSVLSQNEAQIPDRNNPDMPFGSQSLLFRHAIQNGEILGDSGSNAPFGVGIDDQIGVPMLPEPFAKEFPTNLSSEGGMLSSYDALEQPQPEPSSSMISQPHGVADMAFNSINTTMNNGYFMNGGSWGPAQIPRMRTFTKVYKRGAVGRSIDITSYSGYDELKRDLAHRFGIEGQLEDRQRIGWKLVYVDHENDVLLVGDDPWEEFINCVRCIKILSPQEVQQMSLEGDMGNNNIIPNQAGSSSDNGVS